MLKRPLVAGIAGFVLLLVVAFGLAALGSSPERRARVAAPASADVECQAIGCTDPPTTTSTTSTTVAPPTICSPTGFGYTLQDGQCCPIQHLAGAPACPTVDEVPPTPPTSVPPAPEPPPTTDPPPIAETATQPVSGGVSQAWLDQLATCESGNTDGWRTGYFGIEANGVQVGNLSYADQVAWVERILAETGPSAWGCINSGVVPPPY